MTRLEHNIASTAAEGTACLTWEGLPEEFIYCIFTRFLCKAGYSLLLMDEESTVPQNQPWGNSAASSSPSPPITLQAIEQNETCHLPTSRGKVPILGHSLAALPCLHPHIPLSAPRHQNCGAWCTVWESWVGTEHLKLFQPVGSGGVGRMYWEETMGKAW